LDALASTTQIALHVRKLTTANGVTISMMESVKKWELSLLLLAWLLQVHLAMLFAPQMATSAVQLVLS